MVKFIKKRDGRIDRFDPRRVRMAISKAVGAVCFEDREKISETIFNGVVTILNNSFGENGCPTIADVESVIIEESDKNGYVNVSNAYKNYRDKRAEVRKVLEVATKIGSNNTTDSALLIESDSKEVIGTWDRKRIINQLEEEAGLSSDLASEVAKTVENIVVDMYHRGVRKLSTTDVRSLVDLVLKQMGLEAQRKKQGLLGMPSSDIDSIIFSRSCENSNIASNNPEAVNLEIAERIQKQFALDRIFSKDIVEAHLNGAIHIHDLGYPTRVYCSSHSLEYIKKYGLGNVLGNLESKSNPPNSAAVLNQHVQTFLASMQAHYAGALGFGFLNILYAPLINRPVEVITIKIGENLLELENADFQKIVEQRTLTNFEIISVKRKLRELSEKETLQIAQNLIFASSQNAFSRGGQTLFIDFNIHTSVPHYMKNVPAIGPGGKYMVEMPDKTVKSVIEIPRFFNESDSEDFRNGDADSSKLSGELAGGKILTYGDFEDASRKFARALLNVWGMGDKYGRPFHFPKCDLHIEKSSFEDPEQKDLISYAFDIASKNGSVYFMFDRGDGAVLAQCCRLKEKITESAMLKYPERLRFCGFQNVTINIPQAAFRGGDISSTLMHLDNAMEFALKAHEQKAKFIQELLDTPGSPMRNLGLRGEDGEPYINLKKATYIIGVIGLNEAVQALCGKQIHESEESYKLGLEIIAHMYKRIQEFKKRYGLKITIEETPAESATRRFAKVDLKKFAKARGIIRGTEEDPYYTNSIHFSPDAEVGLIDRIVGQSNFHEMIESGAIIHAYIGEKRPDREAIKHIVKKTLEGTRCAQLVFSPTYTECDMCGKVMVGDKKLCENPGCQNHFEESLDKKTLFTVTRIVGYYSRIAHWNKSQIEIYNARKKVEDFYAGESGSDMSWLHIPNGINKTTLIEFGRADCPNCMKLREEVLNKIKELGVGEKTDFKIIHLEKAERKDLVWAAVYGVPFDSVPTLVIARNSGYWRKTMTYSSKCEGSCGVGVGGENTVIGMDEVGQELAREFPEIKV